MKLYFSYASEDINIYQISNIVNIFESEDVTNRVFYWERERDDGYSHMDYMTEKISECDCVIVFGSKNSINSISVNQEIGIALAIKKKIINLFQQSNLDVHSNLRHFPSVEFNTSNEEQFKNSIDNLYYILTGKRLLASKLGKSGMIELEFINKNKELFQITCKSSDSLYTVLTKFCDEQNEIILNLVVVNANKIPLTSEDWEKPMSSIVVSYGKRFFFVFKKLEINYMFRFALVGASSTGKTNIIEKYVENKFSDKNIYYERGYKKLDATFKMKDLNIHGNTMDFNYRIQIWDLNGDKESTQVRCSIYRALAGIFLVADISNPESLDPISTIYIPELDKFLPKNTPRMLILAKCDLSSKIPEEKINVFMKKTNIQDVFYVSAKIGDNIDAPFREMVKRLTLTRIHQNLQNMT